MEGVGVEAGAGAWEEVGGSGNGEVEEGGGEDGGDLGVINNQNIVKRNGKITNADTE